MARSPRRSTTRPEIRLQSEPPSRSPVFAAAACWEGGRTPLLATCPKSPDTMLARSPEPMPPISGPAMCVGNGNDDDSGRLDSIDHAVRKPTQQEPACPVLVRRPGCRRPLDFGRGYVEFVSKPGGSRRTALRIPARSFFGFSERLVEVLKRAGHGRQRRECGDEPPTRARSSLGRSRAIQAVDGSPPTKLPPHRHRRASQDFGLAPRQSQRVLQVGAEAPRRAIA